MDILETLLRQLEWTKKAITLDVDRYEESEFTDEIRTLLSGANRSSTRFASSGGSDALIEFELDELNEAEYLLRAAMWYWMAEGMSKSVQPAGALLYLMKCQRSIGAMNALNHLRKRNARKANKENIDMKHQAIQYWLENINRELSNDKAAEILATQVPLSVRVLSRFVSQAKKELKYQEEAIAELRTRIWTKDSYLLEPFSKNEGDTTC